METIRPNAGIIEPTPISGISAQRRKKRGQRRDQEQMTAPKPHTGLQDKLALAAVNGERTIAPGCRAVRIANAFKAMHDPFPNYRCPLGICKNPFNIGLPV
jgi:hypothetical protein